MIKSLIFDLGNVLIIKNKRTPGLRYQAVNLPLYRFLKKIAKKYKLYSLTNIDETYHKINTNRGIYKIFRKVYTSFETGIEKPDKKAFLMVLKDNSLNPGETLMVDDNSEHLKIAKKLGMKVILFKNNKGFFRELKNKGIK